MAWSEVRPLACASQATRGGSTRMPLIAVQGRNQQGSCEINRGLTLIFAERNMIQKPQF